MRGSISSGDVSGWEVGTTEYGDPQLYLLGPAPDHDCILSISRLGRLYVLEDGKGQVLFENDNIMLMAEQTCSALRKRKAEIVARLTVCWCAVREFFEEKVEPVLAEPMEVITHFAPHLPRWRRRPNRHSQGDLVCRRCRPRARLYL